MKTDKTGRAKRALTLTPHRWHRLRLILAERYEVAQAAVVEARAAHIANESDEAARDRWIAAQNERNIVHALWCAVTEACDR